MSLFGKDFRIAFAQEEGGAAGATTPAPSAAAAEPAPSSSPQPVTPSKVSGETTPGAAERASTNEFDALGLEEFEVEETSQPDTGPAVEKPPVAQPKPAKAPVVEPAAPPPVQTQPSSEARAPDQEGGTPPPSGPEAIIQGLEVPETARQLQEWMSQNTYALSQAEKDALDTDAVGTIPKLMARVHLEGTKNALKLISTLVPQLVESGVSRILQQKERGSEALNEFFKAWPQLSAGEHSTLVNDFARLYRASNPRASRADAIKFVGAAVHAHLGLQLAAPPSTNGGASTPSGASPPPFAPARPGARPIAQVHVEENPWMNLGKDFED
jgi:hypothetical protein